jgi:hypothetical protein
MFVTYWTFLRSITIFGKDGLNVESVAAFCWNIASKTDRKNYNTLPSVLRSNSHKKSTAIIKLFGFYHT